MTPLPKKKHTRSRSNKRRGSVSLSFPHLTKCPSCNKLKESHKACKYCGFYK